MAHLHACSDFWDMVFSVASVVNGTNALILLRVLAIVICIVHGTGYLMVSAGYGGCQMTVFAIPAK